MRTIHHFGIPTNVVQEDEIHLEEAGVYITDPEQSANSIEWLRFESDSPMPDLLKTTSHIAYKVNDLDQEMQGSEILLEPFQPREGLTVAFVIEENAPIELMQFDTAD